MWDHLQKRAMQAVSLQKVQIQREDEQLPRLCSTDVEIKMTPSLIVKWSECDQIHHIDYLVTFGFPFSLSGLLVWCLFLCLLACFLYSFFSFHSWIFCNWYFPWCRNRIIINSFVWWSLDMQSWGRLLALAMCMLAGKSSEGPHTHKKEQVSCLIPQGQGRSACWELLFMNT